MLQLTIEDYQIGWICASPSEYVVAKAALDERHQMVSGQDRSDSNSYTVGRIHKHNVVIACMPLGVDGTSAAAVVATNLCRTFKSVRFGLLVGIGHGIPDLRNGIDIRLGDVVVSQPKGRNGGVIQYDKGKSHDGNYFEFKGHLNKPPTVLLTALSNLKSEHDLEESQMVHYLEEMLRRHPKMRKSGYAFPRGEFDVLICNHSLKKNEACEYCNNDEVVRTPRYSSEPIIHYGVIASGNQVIKSATLRDDLRDKCDGAICVEMEAAGLMDVFPCLVIRGICDYADSAKNEKWHNYAAATAAAFTKELLLYVSAGQIAHEQTVSNILAQIDNTLKEDVEVSIQALEESRVQFQSTKHGSEDKKEKSVYKASRLVTAHNTRTPALIAPTIPADRFWTTRPLSSGSSAPATTSHECQLTLVVENRSD